MVVKAGKDKTGYPRKLTGGWAKSSFPSLVKGWNNGKAFLYPGYRQILVYEHCT